MKKAFVLILIFFCSLQVTSAQKKSTKIPLHSSKHEFKFAIGFYLPEIGYYGGGSNAYGAFDFIYKYRFKEKNYIRAGFNYVTTFDQSNASYKIQLPFDSTKPLTFSSISYHKTIINDFNFLVGYEYRFGNGPVKFILGGDFIIGLRIANKTEEELYFKFQENVNAYVENFKTTKYSHGTFAKVGFQALAGIQFDVSKNVSLNITSNPSFHYVFPNSNKIYLAGIAMDLKDMIPRLGFVAKFPFTKKQKASSKP